MELSVDATQAQVKSISIHVETKKNHSFYLLGRIDRTEYTAGPRGFRPKGNNVVRKYDLSQRRVGPIGNKDDPYFDPYEDPSYNFQFNTRVYNRKEGKFCLLWCNTFGESLILM